MIPVLIEGRILKDRRYNKSEDFNFLAQEACKLIKNTISDAVGRGDVKLAGRYSVLSLRCTETLQLPVGQTF